MSSIEIRELEHDIDELREHLQAQEDIAALERLMNDEMPPAPSR